MKTLRPQSSSLKSSNDLFFDNIESCGIKEIADFLTIAEKKQKHEKSKKFSKKDTQKLIRGINDLLELKGAEDSFANDLSTSLHCLAGLDYKKENLKELKIETISKIVTQELDKLTPRRIADTLNNFSKLGYDKAELEIDSQDLCKAINKKVNNFTGLSAIITLHALAQMGYGDSIDENLKLSLKKLITKSEKKLPLLDARGISSLTHSLAKMEMFEELFALQDSILPTLNSQMSELSSDSASSLLQAQMNCDLLHGRKFFNKEEISSIHEKHIPQVNKISDLQKMVEKSLSDSGFLEIPIYQLDENDDKKSIREMDIVLKLDNKTFYIEVDGPSHYCVSKDNLITPNFATRQRDAVNKAAISRIAGQDPSQELHYLTLSYADIERANNNGDLQSFLNSQIDSAERILPKEMSREMAREMPIETLELNSKVAALKTAEENQIPPAESSNIAAQEKSSETVIAKKPKRKKKSAKEKATTKAEPNKSAMLFEAIENYDFNAVVALIESGIDVEKPFAENGKTPFEFAQNREGADTGILDILVAAGATIPESLEAKKANSLLNNAIDAHKTDLACALINFGKTKKSELLTKAVRSGSLPIVSALVSRDGFNYNDAESRSALLLDIKSDNPDKSMSAELLKVGVTVNYKEIHGGKSKNLEELLAFLANNEHSEAFAHLVIGNTQKILDKVPNIKDKEKGGLNYLLSMAIKANSLDAVNSLIEEGADINQLISMSGREVSPLSFALSSNHYEIAKCLIDKEANVNDATETLYSSAPIPPLLLTMLLNSPVSIMEYLIDNGANVNANCYRNSLLSYAADFPNDDAIKLFISRGGNIDTLSETNGTTPFQQAILNGASAESIAAFIEVGADVNTKIPDSGNPVLIQSIQIGCYDVAEVLMNNPKIKIDEPNLSGTTPLLLSVITDSPKHIIQGLVRNGANADLKLNDDDTILSYIIKSGRENMQSNLLEAINLKELHQSSPSSLANISFDKYPQTKEILKDTILHSQTKMLERRSPQSQPRTSPISPYVEEKTKEEKMEITK